MLKSFIFLEGFLSMMLGVAGQNVGIGTLSPNHALEIHTNSISGGNVQLLLFEDESDFARLKFRNTSGATYWDIAGYSAKSAGDARLNFYYSSTGDVMSLSGNGNVGIGTVNPAQKLDIVGNVNLTGKITGPATGAANLLPVAFGNIRNDGTILSGTGNFSITHPSNGFYRVTLSGDTYSMDTHVAIATVILSSGLTIHTFSDAGTGFLNVVIINPGTLVGTNSYFSFVIYKLN